MKKVLLDCGANHFQGLKKLITDLDADSGWVVHSFEPNPNISVHAPPNVTLHRKAIWIEDGIQPFAVESSRAETGCDINTGGGSTLNQNELIQDLSSPVSFTKIDVPTIDFSEFIKNNFSKEDYIVVKMDIEGAEFEVISKLIDTGVIHYINYLLIEYHDKTFKTAPITPRPFSRIKCEQIKFFNDNNIKFELY
jgi:FkbM family methyltransferase